MGEQSSGNWLAWARSQGPGVPDRVFGILCRDFGWAMPKHPQEAHIAISTGRLAARGLVSPGARCSVLTASQLGLACMV